MADSMFCGECASRVAAGAKFCTACGSRQEPIADLRPTAAPTEASDSQGPSGGNLSTEMDTPERAGPRGGDRCPNCSAHVAPGQRVCRQCATPLVVPDDPWIGRSLGQYRIERVIARGGMGVVYHAFDERLERSVALKLLREDFAADEDFRSRFISESRAAAALDHPNILPVFDAGETSGVLYLATRLVDGADLRRTLEREGSLRPERALSIAAHIGGALDLAHAQGLVHRDVKPANILIVQGEYGDDEHAYLIDFGISKRSDVDLGQTGTGQFVGTAGYAAPEQIRGQLVDGRADQYALACVLFETLTGVPPYPSGTPIDVMHAHLHQPPPRATEVRGGIPPSVDAAMTRALNKDPLRRFDTCRAFIAAARAGEPATARQVAQTPGARPHVPRSPRHSPASPPPAPPTGRRVRLVAALAILLLLGVAGGGAAVLLGKKGHPDGRSATVATLMRDGQVVTVKVAGAPAAVFATTSAAIGQPLNRLDASALPSVSHQLVGYDVELPDWQLVRDDERQPSPPAMARRRTEVADTARGLSLLIDDLTGFADAPSHNRAYLDRVYARTKPGYRNLGMSSYDLGSRQVYEWRFRYDAKDGDEARRVDLMFHDQGHFFAVLASGKAAYDDLSALAQLAAQTIVVNAAEPSSLADSQSSNDLPPASGSGTSPDPRIPISGTYSGIAYQQGDTEALTDDYTVTMTFSSTRSTISYPDLDCNGLLIPNGFNGVRRMYEERITHGTCDQGGSWEVRVLSDQQIKASWTRQGGGDYYVHGTLAR